MGWRPRCQRRSEHGYQRGEKGVGAARLEARSHEAGKVGAAAKPRSKSEVFGTIAQHVGIHRRDVAAGFHVMGSLIKADLSKTGSGVFKVPALMRITVQRKPATKEHQGINPFTKEPMTFKAKPA